MTRVVHNSIGVGAALSLPAAASLWLISAAASTMSPSSLAMFGALWLTTIAVAFIALRDGHTAGRVVRLTRPAQTVPLPAVPAYVVNVSRPVEPWRWTSVLLLPLEIVALAFAVPLVVLLVMVPVGLAAAAALWLGRLIAGRF